MSPGACTGPPPEVLVMAGGEGRRLGALTTRIPKPMLPIGGRPVLHLIFEQLHAQGVRHAYLSVRHLSHVISDYFGDGRQLGIDIDYVVEQQALGTAGAIGLLPSQSKPLLVLNADVVAPVPVGALISHHQKHGADLTVGYVEHRVPMPYGVIECERPDVIRLCEKPDVVLTVLAGVYVLAPQVAARVHRGVALDMPALIEDLLAAKRVVGFLLPGPWLDIGTPDNYARACQVASPAAALPPSGGAVLARQGVTAAALAGVAAGNEER